MTGENQAGTGTENQAGTLPEGSPSNATGKIFSQEEVNAHVAGRVAKMKRDLEKVLEQEKLAAISAWRDEQGITDDVVGELSKRDEKKAAEKKLQKEYQNIQKERDQFRVELDTLRKQVEDSAIKTAIISSASGKAIDPNIIHKIFLDRVKYDQESKSVVLLEEDGTPSTKKLDAAISEYLDANKFLAAPSGSAAGAGSRVNSGNSQVKSDKPLTQEDRLRILNENKGLLFGR